MPNYRTYRVADSTFIGRMLVYLLTGLVAVVYYLIVGLHPLFKPPVKK